MLGASSLASQAAETSRRPDARPAASGSSWTSRCPSSVELGRARMQIQDILKLVPGSIVELDKSAGDPVDILINDAPSRGARSW